MPESPRQTHTEADPIHRAPAVHSPLEPGLRGLWSCFGPTSDPDHTPRVRPQSPDLRLARAWPRASVAGPARNHQSDPHSLTTCPHRMVWDPTTPNLASGRIPEPWPPAESIRVHTACPTPRSLLAFAQSTHSTHTPSGLVLEPRPQSHPRPGFWAAPQPCPHNPAPTAPHNPKIWLALTPTKFSPSTTSPKPTLPLEAPANHHRHLCSGVPTEKRWLDPAHTCIRFCPPSRAHWDP